MASYVANEVLYENGVAKEIKTVSYYNDITIMPMGAETGTFTLQIKVTPTSDWTEVRLFGRKSCEFVIVATTKEAWNGDISNVHKFRLTDVTGFTKIEARIV